MAKLEQMTSWFSGQRRAVAAVLIGWVGVIVIGAGHRPANSGRFAVPDVRDLYTAFIVALFVVCLAFLPFVLSSKKGSRQQPRRAQSLRSLILLFAVAVVLTYALDLQNFGGGVPGIGDPAPPLAGPAEEPAIFAGPARNSVAVLAVLFAAAIAVLLWTRRRLIEPAGAPAAVSFGAEIAPAIELAAHQLLHGSDPRASVLTAYSSLEASLDRHGKGRRLSETPTEHLGRVLAQVPIVTGPAMQLGRLYEVARFSEHPITSDDQRIAADALDRARRDLATSLSVPV